MSDKTNSGPYRGNYGNRPTLNMATDRGKINAPNVTNNKVSGVINVSASFQECHSNRKPNNPGRKQPGDGGKNANINEAHTAIVSAARIEHNEAKDIIVNTEIVVAQTAPAADPPGTDDVGELQSVKDLPQPTADIQS